MRMPYIGSIIFVLLGLLGSFIIISSVDVQGAEPIVVDISDGVVDWVMHEPSGRVFASLSDSNEVIEYSASAGEVRRFKVGKAPTELILKNDRLIVACTNSPALHVIDLHSNQNIGLVKLFGDGPNALFYSRVDNNYVYCICNTDQNRSNAVVIQVDLGRMRIRKQHKIQHWGQLWPVHVAMSPDGKWIVPDSRGKTSPSGADLMKVDEEELTFLQVRDYHDSFGQMVAGPRNRYWTFGDALYTLDITKKVRTFSGAPVAIHPRLDLAASKTSSGLALERFTDASLIGTVTFPVSEEAQQKPSSRLRRRKTPGFDSTVQFDLQHNMVFAGTRYHGYWINLQEYADKIAPLVMIEAPSEVSVLVGKQLRVPLAITSAGEQPALEMRITSGPKSAMIKNNELLWQPKAENVGYHSFQLELKSASDERTLDEAGIAVHVTLPKIDLGFPAKTMELSPNGRYLIAWGPEQDQRSSRLNNNNRDHVAIVDIKEAKVLIHKTLPQGIRSATIDDQYVYISPKSGNLFYRLDHSLSKSKRQFLQSEPSQLIKLSGTQLAVVGEQMYLYDTENMQPIISEDTAFFNSRTNKYIHVLSADRVKVGNRVIDRKTGELVQITGPINIPSLVPVIPQIKTSQSGPNPTTRKWGRCLRGAMLLNYKGNSIAQLPGEREAVISDRWPMAVLITTASQNNKQTDKIMKLCNLIDGSTQHEAVIDTMPTNQSRTSSTYNTDNTLLLTEDTMLYINGSELILAKIPKYIADAMPIPTHFLWAQKNEIEIGGSITLPLAVRGKREGTTFRLLLEHPDVELDEKTGELTIDTESLWDSFVAQTAANNQMRTSRPNQPLPYARDQNEKMYKSLTGKKLPDDKFAAQLPIAAILTDPEGQEDGIEFSVVALGSRNEFDMAMQRSQAEQEKRIAESRHKQQEAMARAAQQKIETQRQADNADKNINQRLDELEARMRMMEAAMNSILKRLEEK